MTTSASLGIVTGTTLAFASSSFFVNQSEVEDALNGIPLEEMGLLRSKD